METWLSKRQVAKMTGLSEKTIDRAIKLGRLERAKNGVRRVLIAASSVAKFMQGPVVQGR